MITILIAFLIAFLSVVLIMPTAITKLKEKDVCGIDVHKLDRPDVAKGGGFVFLFAIVTALLIAVGLTTFVTGGTDRGLLAALVSILIAGMIGLLDDTLDFSNRTKIILPLLASIPIMVMNVGTTTMFLPIIGVLDLGIIYPLIVVPLMMTFIIDSTNMYGGMNGLEVGLAAVNSSAIILYLVSFAFLTGEEANSDTGVIVAALFGASIAFFWFNRYPARILPGDVGRLPMGAAMAAALILGNMDRIAIVLYTPFMINFVLYLLYRVYVKRTGIEYVKFAKPRNDGTLEVVGPFTMYWVLPHFSKKMTEKRNVTLLILLQAIIAYGAILIILLMSVFGVALF